MRRGLGCQCNMEFGNQSGGISGLGWKLEMSRQLKAQAGGWEAMWEVELSRQSGVLSGECGEKC